MNDILSSNVRCAICSPLFEKWGHTVLKLSTGTLQCHTSSTVADLVKFRPA